MRGRGHLVGYLVIMAGLWLAVFGLSGWLGHGWETGPAVLFALCWIGLTTALYWLWRLVVFIITITARAGALIGRAVVRLTSR